MAQARMAATTHGVGVKSRLQAVQIAFVVCLRCFCNIDCLFAWVPRTAGENSALEGTNHLHNYQA